jgi:hypothetical protein
MTMTFEQTTLDDPRLDAVVREESLAWVEQCMEQLARQGRPIAGGWPGTVSEARRLVARRIQTGRGDALRALDAAQHARLVRAVYDCARRAWLERRPKPVRERDLMT